VLAINMCNVLQAVSHYRSGYQGYSAYYRHTKNGKNRNYYKVGQST